MLKEAGADGFPPLFFLLTRRIWQVQSDRFAIFNQRDSELTIGAIYNLMAKQHRTLSHERLGKPVARLDDAKTREAIEDALRLYLEL